MPRGAIWSVAWLVVAALILTPIFYVTAMMNDPVVESSVSPDADSWGIPMFGGVFVALMLTPIILGVTWACTRRYAKPNLLVWRWKRPLRSVVGTGIFLAILAFSIWFWIGDLQSSPPAYELEGVPLFVLAVLWIAMLRAAAITMGEVGEATRGRTGP